MAAAEVHPALYVVEWFVAPLSMYLLLFKWRDRLNILHMPWADFVAQVMLTAFVGSWLLSVAFVVSGYCRLLRQPSANGTA
jgi:hypothetical protein